MAGSSFETDLVEMEAALLTIDNLISDNFGDTTGIAAADAQKPLSPSPFQNGAASDVQQAALPGQLKRAAEADGGNTTFYGQNFEEAYTLNNAHGTLLNSLLELRASVEQGIQTLQQNLQATHKTYSATEQQIDLNVKTISPLKVSQPPASSTKPTG
jgi:hypothetical protein